MAIKKVNKRKGTGERLSKFVTVFKKLNEQEKAKAESKKQGKPRGYTARKFGIFTFWTLFSIMALVVLVNVFSSGSDKGNEVVLQNNKATSVEAVEFSKDFLTKYFSWNDASPYNKDGMKQREQLLSRYLKADLVETAVKSTSVVWDSSLKKESVLLKKTEENGSNRATLTFKINPSYTKTAGAIEEEMKNSTDEDVEITKSARTAKFVDVQIFYDETTNNFVIYELPTFVYLDESDNETAFVPSTKGLKSNDINSQEIKEFLNTFFDSFANDTKQKFSYLFENNEGFDGLNETMEFVSYRDLKVYKGKVDSEQIVTANVELKDPITEIIFTSPYSLVLVQTEQGMLVKDVNVEAYIDEVKDSKENTDVADSDAK